MKHQKTLTGIEFNYEGSLDNGLTIYKKGKIVIPKKFIDVIKSEITRRSPILMGACRDNPSKNSIGEVFKGATVFTSNFELCYPSAY